MLNPGSRLDHYLLGDVVARSGMSTIFRATDTRTGDAVAIKVPHPELECDVVFFDRFHREDLIGRELDHPGVVKVLADDRRSRVYMAMEWVEGRLLREVLADEHRFSLERAVGIARQVLDALEYIHSHGVVHRDLKPENIMLDSADRIKLIDFGLASRSRSRRLTFRGFTKAMGTPDYISPEQVQGKRGDARSDIYSLGIILYEMLTGSPPFEGPNPLAVMNARLLCDPFPPGKADSAIPPKLQAILKRALAREPENRYAHAGDMAWDLDHPDQAGAVVRHAEPPAPQSRLKRLLLYSGLAAIPAAIYSLLLLVARSA